MTPLDQAFEAAKTSTCKRNDFYQLLLNSTLYIPTHDIPTENPTSEQEAFNPIIVESGAENYLMLFDTVEKLTTWAQRPLGYVGLSGHTIAEITMPGLHWALNAGTEFTKIFVPDEVRWLHEAVSNVKDKHINIKPDTEIVIAPPALIPTGLVDQLKQTLATSSKEVSAAFLGQAHYKIDGEKPHFVLVLRVDTSDQAIIDAIQKDLAITAKVFISTDTYIDICLDDGGKVATEITKKITPFYIR